MFEKIKKFIGISELEYDEEDPVEEKKTDKKYFTGNMNKEKETYKYVAGAGNTFTKANNADIIIVNPVAYEDCVKIVDDIKRGKTVVLNLEDLEFDFKKQIFEFVKGAVYALEANMQKASDDIIIISPKNIEITGKTKIKLK